MSILNGSTNIINLSKHSIRIRIKTLKIATIKYKTDKLSKHSIRIRIKTKEVRVFYGFYEY